MSNEYSLQNLTEASEHLERAIDAAKKGDDADLEAWIRFLRTRLLPQTVTAVDGRDRTSSQNKLMWLWATEAGREIGETPEEVQRRWKLHHGVPILREDDEGFRDTYDAMIRPLQYPGKLELMRYLDVTSQMKVRQMVRFLDAVAAECAENGIKLTDPDPDLAAYQARFRAKEAA